MSDAKGAAWRAQRKGPPPATLQKEVIDIPQPKSNELLVEVKFAGLNPVDWKLAMHLPTFLQSIPRTMGSDVSGIVTGHGPSISAEDKQRFPIGSRIVGIVPADDLVGGKGQGTLATHTLIEPAHAAVLPDSFSFEQAGGLSIVGLTALGCANHAKKGDRVLVLGGTTSVGLLLLEMLKHDGAGHIVATASGDKKKVAQEKGANTVIDYRSENVIDVLKRDYSAPEQQFDVILDTVGSFDVFKACPAFLRKDGFYYNIGASALVPELSLGGVFSTMSSMFTFFLPWWLGGVRRRSHVGGLDKTALSELVEKYVKTGVLHPVTDTVFVFDDVKEAYSRIMTGRALGKVLVQVSK